jgi:YbbR domain-containing protein
VVPIEYRNIPQNWVIADPKPTDARISLSGSERAFNFDPAGLVISLDMNAIRDGTQDIVITDKSINVPSRVSISMISPKKISVRAYQMVEIMLPVKAQFVGQLPDTLAVGSVEYQPPYVAVLVPKGRSGRDAEVRTESINLSDFRQTGAVRCNIIPPESGQLSDRAPQSVRVTITIARKS